METLAEFRTALRRMVGDAYNDEDGWGNDLLDAGLRGGLRLVAESGPIVEESLTVSADGYEIDVSSLAVVDVLSLAWPWADGRYYPSLMRRYRMVDGQTVRLDGCEMQTGDVVRLRFRSRRTIQGLDDAAVTTILEAEEAAFLYAAASATLDTRARQLDARPSAPKGEAEALRKLADRWETRFFDMVLGHGAAVDWGDIGL